MEVNIPLDSGFHHLGNALFRDYSDMISCGGMGHAKPPFKDLPYILEEPLQFRLRTAALEISGIVIYL